MCHTASRWLLASFTGCSALLLCQTTAGPVALAREHEQQSGTQPADSTGVVDTEEECPSEAERIARLTRSIEQNERQIETLKKNVNAPESEYAKAEAEFKRLDALLESKTKDLRDAETPTSAPASELDALQQQRKLARNRFDLAIQERKTSLEKIATLEKRVGQDRAALEKLLSPPAATQPATAPSADDGIMAQTATPPLTSGTSLMKSALGGVTADTAAPAHVVSSATESPSPKTASQPPSEELLKARQEAQTKAAQAAQAEGEVRSVGERLQSLRKNIELERRLLETARKKAANAQETEHTLSDQAQQRWSEAAPHDEVRALWTQAREAQRRYRAAQVEVEAKVNRLSELENEYGELQAEQIATLKQAEQKRQEAEETRRAVERLENPFSVRNLLQWFFAHGPRVVGILAGMAALLWVARRLENRLIRVLVAHSDQGSLGDRENRARTLVGVFHSAAGIAVVAGGVLMILTEVGVNIVPLMGGAAVIGLAAAFGAQNLVRDYFYGFMILLENQYTVNDVVKLGDVSGQVERITLRLTVLRGLDGTVHFVPNGEIKRVSNMTHEWSRALFNVQVAYREDLDEVIRVILQLGDELKRDPAWAELLLDHLQMLGVDELGDSGINIKFFIKTQPLRQWEVKRELLRRIKKRFDELGIEIPFPQRTVHHRFDEAMYAAAANR